MSGIAGIIRYDGEAIQNQLLETMQSSLRHRGFDWNGTWQSSCAGLVYLGNHITRDCYAQRLPYESPTSGLIITADARLDNREELLDCLRITDQNTPDGEIILSAHEKWGEGCPDHLLGDFAFAIWDPSRKQLFCARDHMGVRPFYYFHSQRCFVFGSEIKAILQVSDAPRRLNEAQLGDFLCHVFEDTAVTFYKDIYRLPAGCCVRVDAGGTKIRPYWKLDPSREIQLRSDGEYAEAFRSIFTEAVRCRLRSEQPVGSTLSGGLDSSSITGMARDLLKNSNRSPLQTFSAIFPGLPEKDLKLIDERKYIAAVVNMGGIEPNYVRADLVSPFSDLERIMWHQDEPVMAPNLYMHWALYGAARDQGIRVFLDGLDGDTTVSHGLDYLPQLLMRGRWIRLAKEARALSRRYELSRGDALWRFAFRPSIPEPAIRGWRVLRRRKQPDDHALALLNPDFVRRIRLVDRLHAIEKNEPLIPRSARENHLRSIKAPLIPYTLELADRSAAVFSLEARYPFFDRRLIEFSLAIPVSQKLCQGWPRMVLRRAMHGVLPTDVQWRHSKGNLSPNFIHGLLQCERERLERTLCDDACLIEPYLNIAALRQIFYRNVTASKKSSKDALTLYCVVMLVNWMRKLKVSA
jgi:asparagine synthase (glutamine-hydrolysing)